MDNDMNTNVYQNDRELKMNCLTWGVYKPQMSVNLHFANEPNLSWQQFSSVATRERDIWCISLVLVVYLVLRFIRLTIRSAIKSVGTDAIRSVTEGLIGTGSGLTTIQIDQSWVSYEMSGEKSCMARNLHTAGVTSTGAGVTIGVSGTITKPSSNPVDS